MLCARRWSLYIQTLDSNSETLLSGYLLKLINIASSGADLVDDARGERQAAAGCGKRTCPCSNAHMSARDRVSPLAQRDRRHGCCLVAFTNRYDFIHNK